jgi:hypothetical protein
MFLLLIVRYQHAIAQFGNRMWYTRPTGQFGEALILVGNGKTGATVLGSVHSDLIHLNDATSWGGGTVDPKDNLDVSYLVSQVRAALAKGGRNTSLVRIYPIKQVKNSR